MSLWEGAAGALFGAIAGGCIPLTWAWWRRRVERAGELRGMLAEWLRIHVQLQALLEANVAAPLYRLPISLTMKTLPKLIGDGVLANNEVYALIEWVNRIEELNRGLDRAGDAHALNDGPRVQAEYARNIAKVREILEEHLQRHSGQTLSDAARSVLMRLTEPGPARNIMQSVQRWFSS